MIKNKLTNLKKMNPLIHNITNYVTVNDCANILLAVGASPIMSDDQKDAPEITKICNALNINIGTLNQRTIKSMKKTIAAANKLNHPVILDPVGAGASNLRTNTVKMLINKYHFACIKGNISEIKTIIKNTNSTKGVDASDNDLLDNNTIDETIQYLKEFSKKINSIIVVTGKMDLVVYHNKAAIITNGCEIMKSVTGTGCMLNSLLAAFLSSNIDDPFGASIACVTMMGLCGELAYQKLSNQGNMTFRNYLIDEVYLMSEEKLLNGARYEIR